MAEAFSAAAAGVALFANFKHLYTYLRRLKESMNSLNDDINVLQIELESFHELCEIVVQMRDRLNEQDIPITGLTRLLNALDEVLTSTNSAINACHSKLVDVYGVDPQRRVLEAVKQWRKFRAVQPAIETFRSRMSENRGKITVYLGTLNLDTNFLFQRENMKYRERNDKVSQVKHFAISKPVESHFVGRKTELVNIEAAFWSDHQPAIRRQKRFVICGVAGSGKTQLGGSYAQECRERYWGVFWIDGASIDRLQSSLISNVAEKVGLDRDYNAALHWLSGQDDDWLLIIDNADNPDLDLVDFFPPGSNGHVLITTRNQDCAFDNIGSMALSGMPEADANELFLKMAKVPGTPENRVRMNALLHELGYLALAIVVAGSTIQQDHCTMENYLDYLERSWKDSIPHDVATRERRVKAQFDLSFIAIKDRATQAAERQDVQDEMAARDASELLRTFAYMHRENVRYRFLKLCAENSKKERAKREAEKAVISIATQSWTQRLGQSLIDNLSWFYTKPSGHSAATVLPDVLRAAQATGILDEDRVLRAMGLLRRHSLVTYDQETDSWYMHPLVHRWARDIHESNPGEHHIWCSAAATIISESFVLTEDRDEDELIMKQILPHVIEIGKRKRALDNRIIDNRQSRNKWYPVMDWGAIPHSTLKDAKLSKVYLAVGLLMEADELQRVAHHALEAMHGYEDATTRYVTIMWARTLKALGKADEQAKILETLLDNCRRTFGPDHRETHVASINLADARLQQGRISEARSLCDESVPGLETQSGEDEETLHAFDVYATAILLTGTKEAVIQAKHIYRRAWGTKEHILSQEHIDTLDSRQNFYATSLWNDDQGAHREAEQGLRAILDLLRKKLGGDHPRTLQSMLYLARVKIELQDFRGAQQLFDEGLPIAERMCGKDHVGVLSFRFHIGRMRIRQKRWREARDELIDVSAKQSVVLQGWRRHHFIRLQTLTELARAHHELGEYVECDAVVEEASRGFRCHMGMTHPWAERLRMNHEDWKSQRTRVRLTTTASSAVNQTVGHIDQVPHLVEFFALDKQPES